MFKIKSFEKRYSINVGDYFMYKDDPIIYKIIGRYPTGVTYAWMDADGEIANSKGGKISYKNFEECVAQGIYIFVSEDVVSDELKKYRGNKYV